MESQREKPKINSRGMSRRAFVGGSAAALAGIGLNPPRNVLSKSGQSHEEIKIKEFRTLGRTGFEVSDISFGSGELTEGALLSAILDAGVNYIDAAESYGRGRVERVIGDVLKQRDRKKIFVTTKMGVRRNDTKKTVIERFHKSLDRLQTSYADCLMTHAPATVEALKNEVFLNAFSELKSQGKVRFCGVSNHGSQWNDVPDTMEKVLTAAAEDGRFDVMLLVYNFLQREQGEKVLEACKKHHVGATLMKTNPVLNYEEMKANAEQAAAEKGEVPGYLQKMLPRLKDRADRAEAFRKKYNLTEFDAVRDAAIRFVLSNPHVSCACPTIKNFEDLEFYVGLSGKRFGEAEKATLAAYAASGGEFYCRHACGSCESACPSGVPVNTIMRYNHYFLSQHREKTALTKYAALPTSIADACSRCAGYCEKACPYGVPIQGMLVLAHSTLTLNG